jgi:hypothetical protein
MDPTDTDRTPSNPNSMHEMAGQTTDSVPDSPTAQFKYFLNLPVEIRIKIYDLVLFPIGGRIDLKE